MKFLSAKTLCIIIVLLASFKTANAQNTIDQIIEQFFSIYKDQPIKAVDYAFGTNTWMIERNQDGIQNVKTQLTSFLNLVGDYYGYEKITEKSLGQSYKLISYLVKYDRQPVRFTFKFYKPADTWQVQSFQYDDSFGEELEESGKAYRLKENWD